MKTSPTPLLTPSREQKDDEAKRLYLGPDRAGNLLEVVTVTREQGDEVAVHAMPMRRRYEYLLREVGLTDD